METILSNPAEIVSVITLTRGYSTVVDTHNLSRLSRHKWHLAKSGKELYYARRTERCGKKNKAIYMHREILDAPDGMEVDHINGNGLDNKESNIRICTRKQNKQNSWKTNNKTSSRFKGVDWDKSRRLWRVRIMLDRKNTFIGRFKSEFLAAKAYDQKAVELFGEFANLNITSEQSKLISQEKQNGNARLFEFSNNRYGTDNN